MLKKMVVAWLAIQVFSFGIARADQGSGALLGSEAGGNGDHLTGWFTALGYQLLNEFRKFEKETGQPVVRELSLKEFASALKTPLVLVGAKNRAMLRNKYGEVKDVRVVTEQRSGLPVLLINEAQLTEMYNKGRPDFRIVMHAYLLAAGKDDDDYKISARIQYPAAAAAAPLPAKKSLYEVAKANDGKEYWLAEFTVDGASGIQSFVDGGYERTLQVVYVSDTRFQLMNYLEKGKALTFAKLGERHVALGRGVEDSASRQGGAQTIAADKVTDWQIEMSDEYITLSYDYQGRKHRMFYVAR